MDPKEAADAVGAASSSQEAPEAVARRALAKVAEIADKVARPIVKSAKAQSSWRLTCSDTPAECLAELVLYTAFLLCLALAARAVLMRLRYSSSYRGRQAFALLKGERESLRDIEMEEGWGGRGVVDAEEFGLNRVGSVGSSVDGSERGGGGAAAAGKFVRGAPAGWLELDDYAPPLSTLITAKVTSLVEEAP